jgi:hypothetical protein
MGNIHAKDVGEAVSKWLASGNDGSIFNIAPSECPTSRDWIRIWGRNKNKKIIPLLTPRIFIRLMDFGIKLLKRIMGKRGRGDVKYAIACATRDICYSNRRLKDSLNWRDEATSRYIKNGRGD